MLPVVWSTDALSDLEEISDYISLRNPPAADRIQNIIEVCVERLPNQPYIHRPGRVAGTREAVVHPNYIVIYRIKSDAIEIVAVLHARQSYP